MRSSDVRAAEPNDRYSRDPIEVFYPYAREDAHLADRLRNHLRILWRQGVISDWWSRRISPDEDFGGQISEHLEAARLVLPLISPDFLSSGYSQSVEMKTALERDRIGAARVVPILLRSVHREMSPFSRLDALPTDERPVTGWRNLDEAFANVAAGIRTAVQELLPQASFGLAAAVPIPESDPRAVRALPRAWNVPLPRNPAFVGRDSLLDRLHETFTSDRPGSGAQVVYGPPGCGKTSVAVEYAYRYADDYRIVWWIRAEQATTLTADYAALAWRVGLPEGSWPAQDAVAAAVRRWLATRSDWLLIFDNASDPSLVAHYLPPEALGNILITSRLPNWEGIANATALTGLSEESAIYLIAKHTGRADADAAAALAKIQGAMNPQPGPGTHVVSGPKPAYSPLALEHASAYLNATDSSVASFAAALDEAKKHQTGRLEAHAEQFVTIEVEGRAPPYLKLSEMERLARDVPPGPYHLTYRLGAEVFDESDTFVVAGETITASAVAPASPLVRELREWLDRIRDEKPGDLPANLSSLHSGVLDTVLAMIGISPFRSEMTFQAFRATLPSTDNAQIGRPLSIVLALDGDGWNDQAEIARASTRVRLGSIRGDIPATGHEAAVTPVEHLRRVGVVLTTAPHGQFSVVIKSPYFGTISLVASALEHRCTVITVRIHFAGKVEVSQNLFQISSPRYPEHVPHVPFERIVRCIQMGQMLYRSSELVPAGPLRDIYEFRELFTARWTDPILSCMAFFSLQDTIQRGAHSFEVGPQALEEIGRNLFRYFGNLADAKVVHALSSESTGRAVLDQMLRRDEVPLLARSALVLAAHARATEKPQAAVAGWVPRLLPDLPWTMTWSVEDLAAESAGSG